MSTKKMPKETPKTMTAKNELTSEFKNRVILVTGASSGIGHAAAVDFANHGATVYAGVRKAEQAQELTRLSASCGGGVLRPLLFDVTDPAQVEHAIQEIKKHSGRLDAVINNAGLTVAGPVEGIPLEDYRTQFEVNFFGVVAVTQKALPLIRQSKGRVLMISSVNGRMTSPFLSAYSASKFALEGFSNALRLEMDPFGVRVCLIEPGPIRTPIWKKALDRGNELEANWPDDLKKLYAKPLANMRKLASRAEETARPVEDVLVALRHALSSRNPKPRYVIGQDNKTILLLNDILPTQFLDKIVLRAVRTGEGKMH